ncbi:carbohydrate ABC transporter permease [Rugosimonospora acidiphila]|uniref:Carbohydrate ABC transporter permease n=1 Tax=Rugosimonospora acidiphila TaxID=556531 RepID=A0ABP9S5V3_9ACTN
MRETNAGRWVRRVALTLIGIFTLLPVLIILDTSVKPLAEVQDAFSWWPHHFTLHAYVQMWHTVPLAHYFLNSIIVSVVAAAISVVLATLAAYAVSRFAFVGRRLFSFAVLSTQMFPGILFLLPLYLIFINLQRYTGIALSGSLLGLIITYLTFALPFSIWMLIGFFDTIPRELEEAAFVDGTGRWGALWRIVLPVARPGIIAVAIFAYMTAWGEVLFASVLTTESTRTLAIGLQEYATRNVTDWNQIMAASVVVSIPVVGGFLAVQRFLIRGLTAGAVK